MSSILLNSNAMQALREFRKYDKQSAENTKNIGTGKRIHSGKDNAAYYNASQVSDKQARALKAVHETMNLAKNAISISRLSSEKVYDLSEQIKQNIALARSIDSTASAEDIAEIQKNIDGLVREMKATLDVSSFNGDSFLGTGTKSVITGFKVDTAGNSIATTVDIDAQDLDTIYNNFASIDLNISFGPPSIIENDLQNAETWTHDANTSATYLGISEKTIEEHQNMLKPLADIIIEGASRLVDADMEREAARKSAIDVQKQLATQSISMTGPRADGLLTLLGG
jgi:flagellin